MNSQMREAVSVAQAQDQVMVWAARLDPAAGQIAYLRGLLSADELERAARFYFELHRQRFIVARGTLRCILGQYLDKKPADIQFVYGAQGKPALDDETPLHFNVSHSHDIALFAIAFQHEVGVDIEFMRPLDDIDQLAARTFSAHEYANWALLPESQKQVGFFNCWTRKEAFIKALGQGLAYPLTDFDVTLQPGEAARFLRIEREAVGQWGLVNLQPAPDFAAAIAAPTANLDVRLTWWNSSLDADPVERK